MVSDAVREMARELPEHQSGRGDEFRAIPEEDRYGMAHALVIARSQADTNTDRRNKMYRRSMREKKEQYYYEAGVLGIERSEVDRIWWSVVHDNPAPFERVQRRLI